MSAETHGDGILVVPTGTPVLTPADLPAGSRVAVVCSRYHSNVMQKLLDGALAAATARGVACDVIPSEGAFELPMLARAAAQTGRYVAVAVLGCVIRGETSHYDYVCSEAARGTLLTGLETGIPVAFGVITTENAQQAFDRAGGVAGHKGAEAVETALTTAATLARIRASSRS